MDKKGGMNISSSLVVFLVLNILFFAALFIFVGRVGSQTAVYEQIYAKQIALLVDYAKPGTNLSIDLSQGYELARKNGNIGEKLVKINPETKEVNVKITWQGEGYSFQHFNGNIVVWGEDSHYEKLYVQILPKPAGAAA